MFITEKGYILPSDIENYTFIASQSIYKFEYCLYNQFIYYIVVKNLTQNKQQKKN